MIRPLRRAHLAIWTALAVALALGFLAGMAVRKGPAIMEHLPAELR